MTVAVAGCARTTTIEPESPISISSRPGAAPILTLSERAARRLGLAVATVRALPAPGVALWVIPAGALLYAPDGTASVYAEVAPRSFERQILTVLATGADLVLVTNGPQDGMRVVTVGAAELLGAESGLDAGH